MGAKRDYALIKHGHLLSELDDIDITSPADNSVLQYDSASGTWQDVSLASFNSQLDHGLLSGNADDDHPQYPLAAGTETISGKWTFSNAKTLFTASSYVSNVPSLTETQLDAIAATGPISTMTEHSFRCIRENSPNFTGVAWGAPMSGARAAATTGDILVTFRGDAYDGTGTEGDHYEAGELQVVASENWTATHHGAQLDFWVTPNGTTTLVNAVRITNGGELQVLRDSDEIQIGAGQDLRLYHDGTDSYVRNDTGTLQVMGSTVRGSASTYTAWSTPNLSAATLTTITGSGTPTTIFERSLKVIRSSSPVFNGIAWGAATSGSQAAAGSGTILFTLRGSAYYDTSSVANFRDGAELQFVTSEAWDSTHGGTQIDFFVTPNASTTQANVARITNGGEFQILRDSDEIQLGASQDLRLYHDGTNSIVRTDTGGLRLQFSTNNRIEVDTTGVGFNGQTPIARPDYTITNPTTNRSIDVSGITHANLAQVVGTMIQDLINYGLYQ